MNISKKVYMILYPIYRDNFYTHEVPWYHLTWNIIVYYWEKSIPGDLFSRRGYIISILYILWCVPK